MVRNPLHRPKWLAKAWDSGQEANQDNAERTRAMQVASTTNMYRM